MNKMEEKIPHKTKTFYQWLKSIFTDKTLWRKRISEFKDFIKDFISVFIWESILGAFCFISGLYFTLVYFATLVNLFTIPLIFFGILFILHAEYREENDC